MRSLLVALLLATAASAASIGGRYAPDKTPIQLDLPASQMLHNTGGSDGAGLCVFTSINHAALWSHVELLEGFRDYMTKYPGGGWPQKVDQYIAKIAKEKGVPVPSYVQAEGMNSLDLLKAATSAGRMPGVTYSYSPTGRYNGQKIAHMVNLVHMDDTYACILDNNYPGDDKYEWMTIAEFQKVYAPGWCVILLDAPPPNPPTN